MPATTCALVITSSGAKTKPEPSSCRWHDGALPRILRTLGCAVATAALWASATFGGPVAVTGVRAKGLNTSGKPELSRSCRSSAGSCLAAVGMTESIALQHLRAPHAGRDRGQARGGQRQRDQPSCDDHGERLQDGAEDRVDGQRALAGDAVAHPTAEEDAGGLAQHDQHHHNGNAHDHPGVRVADALGQEGSHAHPDDRAAEHADERQQRHCHAVSPARDGREQRERDDDEIDPAHQAPPGTAGWSAGARQRSITLTRPHGPVTSCRSARAVLHAPSSSRIRAVSQGRAQPPRSNSADNMPAGETPHEQPRHDERGPMIARRVPDRAADWRDRPAERAGRGRPRPSRRGRRRAPRLGGPNARAPA